MEDPPLDQPRVDFFNHISEMNTKLSSGPLYKDFLPLLISGVNCHALVDSGNLFDNVMSKELLFQIGLTLADLEPVDQRSIGTAKEGAKLQVLGRVKKPLHLQMGRLPTRFKTRPVVLEGLSMPFNLSGPFLKQYGIDQLHSKDSLKVQGVCIPLVATIGPPASEVAEANTYVAETITAGPYAVTPVKVRVPAVQKGHMPAGDGFLSGSVAFMGRTDLHPVLDTMVSCSSDGYIVASVMNTLPHAVTLDQGQQYGCFQLARFYDPSALPEQTEESAHPWRVLALSAKPAREEKTDAKKKEEQPLTPGQAEHLIERFHLHDSPFLKDKGNLARAAALLAKHQDVFSFDGSFGKTTLLRHQIKTDPEKGPINQRFRPVNPAMEEDLFAQVQTWLKHGVIEPSTSPWNFGLVAAPKKNGKIRWCVDYRALNDITIKDSHPIGNIDDNLARLSRSTIFSCIDGSGAYHVVELEPADREKTAFATPWGSYHFTHMPFGLCNAPSTYARLVQLVLAGIPYHVALPYLDDTIVHSRTLEQHFHDLDRVLTANGKAGLKLSPDKCLFFKDTVSYLGHIVSANGIRPMDEYIDVIRTWPVPNTRSKVRTFLGKVGYYRRFIKNYAAIAGPLTDLSLIHI